ncbi:Ca-activated chloride channel family protein [Raineyella antarctica]|uniref:Ca-activated chloride channel family protein n=1 Tax=Raineyella antarctica TaxID=1577474 RepID=A0A1G6GWC5_9ACTN|nr:VWA domain-containing protein [Raineyella antarctica]SDB86279.1 Ca-activated chloride channel family protein [Raineyella antarctica]
MEFWRNLTFGDPWRLVLLLLVPAIVGLYVWASHHRGRRGLRFTTTALLQLVGGSRPQWRRHLAVAFSLLSLTAAVVGWARPTTITDVPRERATVVLVMDVSLSMEAVDVRPSRLQAAVAAATQFVDSVPDRYNVSLVTLSGSPAIVVPPTLDHGAVVRALSGLKPQESTAIGDSIVAALRALEQAPRDPQRPDQLAPGAIVLLSDGENTVGSTAQQGARRAADAKVPVYTIAYGTENGYVDVDGKRELVPPDTATLRQVAELTGARAFTADTAGQLDRVYKDIRSEVGVEKKSTDVSSTFAGYAIVAAMLAALAAISLGARWP